MAAKDRATLAIGGGEWGLTAALSYAFPFESQLATLSTASAYAGLALLIVSLSLGPLNILRNRPNPVSTDLRRDVGIWAGLLGLIHTVVGLQVHMGGNFWLYFFFRLANLTFCPSATILSALPTSQG